EFTAVFTNKTIVTPVRGAGRQHGVFVIERLLDFAAKELRIDRAEIRRRNLLRPEQFPFDNQILFQDSAPLTYDSGDYEPALGAEVTDVHVITGDTREFHWGTGTFASRGAVVAGSACHAAAARVREKILELASHELEAAQADLVLEGGRVHVRGDPTGGIALG